MADPMERLLDEVMSGEAPAEMPEALMGMVRLRRRDLVVRSGVLAGVVVMPIVGLVLAMRGGPPLPTVEIGPGDKLVVAPEAGDPAIAQDEIWRHSVVALRNVDPSLERDDFPVVRDARRSNRPVDRAIAHGQIERLLNERE